MHTEIKMIVLKSWRSIVPAFTYCTTSSVKTTRMDQEEGVRTITLCNPKSRNALSLSTLNEIISHMTTDVDDMSLRCIVFRAEGNVFSSGHNLKEFDLGKSSSSHSLKVFSTCSQLMSLIVTSPVPVVALVDGLAAAAGCQLVAQCDIAICTPRSTFSTPGASFGLFCSTPGIALARGVSRKLALRMLLTGLPISAEEAYLSGLVSKVVPTDQLENELKILTKAIETKSRPVVALGKKFFYQQVEKDLNTAYKLGEKIMVDNLELGDGQEGIKSFIEKRKPVWSHISEKET